MEPIKAVLIGAGQRGMDVYAAYALEHPGEIRFVGVCEPDEQRRREFMQLHGIEEHMGFSGWEAFFDGRTEADAVLICTQDQMHFEPAQKAIALGYHVLLEKPMAVDPVECMQLGDMAKAAGNVFSICHVLRYTPFFHRLKQLLEEGRIGQLISIQHNENVGFWHQAHSFVRGHWRRADMSSPMIVAKCCHDMDMLLWLADADCLRVSSFGSLTHFREEHAPPGAPLRCLDGCPVQEECPYYAPRVYLGTDNWQGSVFRSVVSREGDASSVMRALYDGPYGRCVYRCDNDVVDHQVVNLEFANGVTAAFTMSAFTPDCTRTIKLMGSLGEIRGAVEKNEIELTSFVTGTRETIRFNQSAGGHSGGDEGIMRDFVKQVRAGRQGSSRTSAEVSVQSHLIAFAAEAARLRNQVVELEDFRGKLRYYEVKDVQAGAAKDTTPKEA